MLQGLLYLNSGFIYDVMWLHTFHCFQWHPQDLFTLSTATLQLGSETQDCSIKLKDTLLVPRA